MGQALSYCIPQRPENNPLESKTQSNNIEENDDNEEWKDWDEKPQTKSGALQLGAKFKATTTPQTTATTTTTTPNNTNNNTNNSTNTSTKQTTISNESANNTPQNNSPIIAHNSTPNTTTPPTTSTPTASPPPNNNVNGTNTAKPAQSDDFFSDMAPKIVSAPLVAPIKPSRLHLELESMKSESKNLTENSNAWGGDQAEPDIWEDEDEEEIDPARTTGKKDSKNKAAKTENTKKEKPRLVVEKKSTTGGFDDFDDER